MSPNATQYEARVKRDFRATATPVQIAAWRRLYDWLLATPLPPSSPSLQAAPGTPPSARQKGA